MRVTAPGPPGRTRSMRTPCAPSRLTLTPEPIPGLAQQLALTVAGTLGHAEVEALQAFLTGRSPPQGARRYFAIFSQIAEPTAEQEASPPRS